MPTRLPLLIRLWFLADVTLALWPPFHWAGGGSALVLGVPRVLVYLFGTSVFVAASVVAAYLSDPALSELGGG